MQADGKKVTNVPRAGEWFEVIPETINQNLFLAKRKDSRQEQTRQIILEAFAEVKNNPKYAKCFETMMPEEAWVEERTLVARTVLTLGALSYKLGDDMADWIHQALEWAQRICNGETWDAVCNEPDTANCFRLIKWKNGYYRIVGGARNYRNRAPASDVVRYDFALNDKIRDTVPLIVRYKEEA